MDTKRIARLRSVYERAHAFYADPKVLETAKRTVATDLLEHHVATVLELLDDIEELEHELYVAVSQLKGLAPDSKWDVP